MALAVRNELELDDEEEEKQLILSGLVPQVAVRNRCVSRAVGIMHAESEESEGEVQPRSRRLLFLVTA